MLENEMSSVFMVYMWAAFLDFSEASDVFMRLQVEGLVKASLEIMSKTAVRVVASVQRPSHYWDFVEELVQTHRLTSMQLENILYRVIY